MLHEIIEIARQAGSVILTYYDTDIEVTKKEDHSPLTPADLAANELIVTGLKRIDPDTPVISEESPIPNYEERKHWKKFWLVDPLDGTKEFIKRNGEFTVNIALIKDEEPVMAALYAPTTQLLYFAEKGKGSWKQEGNASPVRIYSERADRNKPLRVVTSRAHGSDELESYLKDFQIEERIRVGSSLKLCLVAEGSADFYPRLGPIMEWDVAAGDCIYRNSARDGQHFSSLTYNKPSLKNEQFVIGF